MAFKKRIKTFLLIISLYPLLQISNPCPLFAGFLPKNAFTNKARGTIAASFLKLNPSARAGALAETIALNQIDPLAGFGMPAAYGQLPQQTTLALASSLLPEDILHSAAVFGRPLGRSAKISLITHEVIQPSLRLYDSLGNRTGEFRPLDIAVGAAYASWNKEALWGASVFYFQSKMGPGLSGSGIAASGGVHLPYGYFEDPNLALGASLINFGPPARWATKNMPLPLRCQIEASYKIGEWTYLNLDLANPADQAPYGMASVEWDIPFLKKNSENDFDASSGGMTLRVGISSKNKTDSFSRKLSYGIGLRLGRATANFSLTPFGNLGAFPSLSLSLAF